MKPNNRQVLISILFGLSLCLVLVFGFNVDMNYQKDVKYECVEWKGVFNGKPMNYVDTEKECLEICERQELGECYVVRESVNIDGGIDVLTCRGDGFWLFNEPCVRYGVVK